MTFIPENATVCKCASAVPIDEAVNRPFGMKGLPGCPQCDGMGWYWQPDLSFQARQRRQSPWWRRVRFKRAK